MFSHESLEIWQLAISFAKDVYRATSVFPKDEIYGLTNQLRRAVISISANIAEGSGSTSTKDKTHYMDIAVKSALEVSSEIEIAYQLRYIDKENRDRLYESAEKIVRKIRAYKKFLKNDNRLPITDKPT